MTPNCESDDAEWRRHAEGQVYGSSSAKANGQLLATLLASTPCLSPATGHETENLSTCRLSSTRCQELTF